MDSITYICELGFTMATVTRVVKITLESVESESDDYVTSPPAPPAPALQTPSPGSRRAEIALVAAEEFTRRGYHSTRVEHIAERLGVTPGALYRHVPGKYEMFRDAVAVLVDELETATASATASVAQSDPAAGGSHPEALAVVVGSVTRTTLTHRSRAALYRWQARYLTPGDRAAVVAAETRVRARVAEAVRGRRRGEPTPGAGSAAAAILSCIASLGFHRIEITESDAITLLTSIADDLALSDPRPREQPSPRPAQSESVPVARLRGGAATREGAIEAAIARFHSSGYDSVTMEAIGADVGVAASALYRHFPGKSALLKAAVDRTATLVEHLLDQHGALHSATSDPAAALADLLEQYVEIAFSHGPELMLYHSELGALDVADRRRLRRAQRGQLERWARLVLEASGVQDPSEAEEELARIRVHAALAVVLDGGQGTGFHPSATARLGDLARLTLLPR